MRWLPWGPYHYGASQAAAMAEHNEVANQATTRIVFATPMTGWYETRWHTGSSRYRGSY